MFRVSRGPLLTDTYRAFASTLLRKVRSCRSAVELSSTVKDILAAESKVMSNNNRMSSRHQHRRTDNNSSASSETTTARRVSAINSLLTECQTHHLWRQAVVVLTVARDMGVPLKPLWFHMACSAAPDLQSRAVVVERLRPVMGHHASMTFSSSSSAATNQDETSSTPSSELEQLTASSSSSSLTAIQQQQTTTIAHTPTNPLFDHFYQVQRIARSESELALLCDALRRRPMLTFRVNICGSNGGVAGGAWPAVAAAARSLAGVEPLPWCSPFGLVFQVNDSSNDNSNRSSSLSINVKNDDSGRSLSRTHEWIRRQAAAGLITLQSPSSLLVGSLLDPQPTDAVLDMCAAPGTKTRQILDQMMYLHQQQQHHHHQQLPSTLSSLLPPGVVLANESSPHRHRMLSNSLLGGNNNNNSSSSTIAAANALVTWAAGASVPAFSRLGLWDRVLVDAPCSGDGMLHKAPEQWARWSPATGLRQHRGQVELLRRAVAVTKNGGRIVYSTCTMNPLENEAVVAAVLREGECEVEPVQQQPHVQQMMRMMMPRMGYSPPLARGLREWMVPVQQTRTGAQPFFYVSSAHDESTRSGGGVDVGGGVVPSSASLFNNDTGVATQLTQCGRLYPHVHHGFDAFFVAVLRKKQKQQQHEKFALINSSIFGRPHAGAAQEARRLREAARLGQQLSESVLLPHFSFAGGEKEEHAEEGGGPLAAQHQHRFLLFGGELRVVSEKVWAIAADESRAMCLLPNNSSSSTAASACLGTVVAKVSSSSSSSLRLTAAGAAIFGPSATRNVVLLPAAAFRLFLGSTTTTTSATGGGVLETDLAAASIDRSRMSRGRRARFEEDDDDDKKIKKTPEWLEQLRQCYWSNNNSSKHHHGNNNNKSIIVGCRFDFGPIYVPAVRIGSNQEEMRLVCELDTTERRRLQALLTEGQESSVPRRVVDAVQPSALTEPKQQKRVIVYEV